MLTFRRLLILSFFCRVIALATAQTAAPGPERLSLDDAVRRAVAKNFTIQSDSYDVAIAKARVLEQLGIFDPQLTGSFTYRENEIPGTTFTAGLRDFTVSQSDDYSLGLAGLLPWGMTYTLGATASNSRGTFNLFADSYSTFAGITARQPLLRGFGFGNTTAQIRIAQTNRAITEWQFKQSVIDTVTRVIYAYYDLNFAHASLRSAQRSRELAAQLLDENEKRFRVGAMSEFDVTSARSRLANREEGILNAERFVREAGNALKALISDERTMRLHEWQIEIEPMITLPFTVVDARLDFQEALKKRPDYQQAQLNLKRSAINARYQRNQLLPRVDLVGSYGYNGVDPSRATAQRLVRDQDHPNFSYGVQVTIPLTFTTERGRHRAAKFGQRQAEIDLAQVEQNIVVAVGNTAANISTTHARVEAARRARELGEQTLDAEQKRLRAGTGNTFFVVQQQELLAFVEIAELRAEADYRKAVAEYDRQLGITLEKLNISVAAPK
ncbi:MAG: TolC family protein [Candidatus Didemnitutus sp.]|nr:TolC family protein [Candidatus Didemnitutus sp.]